MIPYGNSSEDRRLMVSQRVKLLLLGNILLPLGSNHGRQGCLFVIVVGGKTMATAIQIKAPDCAA